MPSVPIKVVDADGVSDAASSDVLGAGLVVFFSVPGAFTPTCHTNHLPGFIAAAAEMKAAGADRIVCAAANDHHVVKAWAEASGALDAVSFIADGNADLARALGLDRDMTPGGMGVRFRRAAMILRDGVVEQVFEDRPGELVATGAPAVLLALRGAGG